MAGQESFQCCDTTQDCRLAADVCSPDYFECTPPACAFRDCSIVGDPCEASTDCCADVLTCSSESMCVAPQCSGEENCACDPSDTTGNQCNGLLQCAQEGILTGTCQVCPVEPSVLFTGQKAGRVLMRATPPNAIMCMRPPVLLETTVSPGNGMQSVLFNAAVRRWGRQAHRS